jgi:shikimate kinase
MKKRPGIRSIEAMLHQREPLYLDAADIVVDARRAMASVAEVIADEFA